MHLLISPFCLSLTANRANSSIINGFTIIDHEFGDSTKDWSRSSKNKKLVKGFRVNAVSPDKE
jgi:hypothetical protein